MELTDEIRSQLLKAISEKFALEDVENVDVTSLEVDEQKREIRIVLSITADSEPKSVADGYFGLTGRVRKVLGKEWGDFFPVITPRISNDVHA